MPDPNEEGPCNCFSFSSCEAERWTCSAGHADGAHGSCAASHVPRQPVLVVVATLGAMSWRDCLYDLTSGVSQDTRFFFQLGQKVGRRLCNGVGLGEKH